MCLFCIDLGYIYNYSLIVYILYTSINCHLLSYKLLQSDNQNNLVLCNI